MFLKKKYIIYLLSISLVSVLFWFSLPSSLFNDPLSTVVYDRNGDLLGARIAKDGQWRFPGVDTVPEKYKLALIQYEDQYFHYHPGINPVSLSRALVQNIKSGKIVSGGSTITMQVMRMARKNRARTIRQKIIESYLALRYEFTASKEEILRSYTNNAPFGGNVVGIEAAAWRYFGTAPDDLTWSEAALLAVLPNAPSLIHPGKNRDLLKEKRNELLQDLFEKGIIDDLTLGLAKEEPLPAKPLALPNLAPHLTDKVMLQESGRKYYSNIDASLQERVTELAFMRSNSLQNNQIHNIGCLLMEVESGKVLAYVGNVEASPGSTHGNAVDVIQARRSTGSILKPFLFAGLLDNGDILQTALVPDVPIRYNGYAPKNYDRGYEGAVPAYEALERSLNIPSVILLKKYGVDPFLSLLRNLGFTTFDKSHEHYGLTLILGGAEASLWELAGVYSSMARVLNHYSRSNGNYYPGDYHMPIFRQEETNIETKTRQEEGTLSASSIYITFKSLLEVNRPEELSLWYLMNSSRNIAWKTGTSYGFRDAWAVGVSPEYVVAVWAGNADGEGRPGLTGLTAAAPLMFDVFSLLPETSWFEAPLDDLKDVVICKESGYLAGPFCGETDTIQAVPKGMKSKPCPYHKLVHLDKTKSYRVSSSCYAVSEMESEPWFILPPLMEWYYKRNNPSYRELPLVMSGCVDKSIEQLEIVYPEWDSHLVIPRELDGTKGKVILEVAHRNPAIKVFWHIDEAFVGTTINVHQLALDILPGKHTLTVIDEAGNEKSVRFEVLR